MRKAEAEKQALLDDWYFRVEVLDAMLASETHYYARSLEQATKLQRLFGGVIKQYDSVSRFWKAVPETGK